MTLRKEIKYQIKNLDESVTESFKEVEDDITTLIDIMQSLNDNMKQLNEYVSMEDNKINALADYLGVNLELKHERVIDEHVVATKVKKGKK